MSSSSTADFKAGDFKCLASRARLAESSRRGWVLSKQQGEIPLRNPVVDPGSPPTIDHLSEAADTPFAEALERLAERGLQRRLRPTSGRQGPRMRVDGHDVLMMAGSNYLDLAGDERVLAAAVEATERYGTASGGARLISGNLELFESLERDLASFLGLEAALLFSTGYMANLGVLTALAGPGDAIVSDELNHASIIDACSCRAPASHVFRHNDARDLERVARETADARRRVLVLDGVYSMDGDVSRLEELVPVARAHGMHGRARRRARLRRARQVGSRLARALRREVDLVIGNLGKALGSFGAFVACSSRRARLPAEHVAQLHLHLRPAARVRGRRRAPRSRSWPTRAGAASACTARGAASRGPAPTPATTRARAARRSFPPSSASNDTVMRLCERALAARRLRPGHPLPVGARGHRAHPLHPTCAHERQTTWIASSSSFARGPTRSPLSMDDLFERDRRHLWHPFTQMEDWLDGRPLVIERGEGNYLIDTEGHRYLDGISSMWVNLHGHDHPEIRRAVHEQLDKLAHSTLLGLASIPSIELATRSSWRSHRRVSSACSSATTARRRWRSR